MGLVIYPRWNTKLSALCENEVWFNPARNYGWNCMFFASLIAVSHRQAVGELRSSFSMVSTSNVYQHTVVLALPLADRMFRSSVCMFEIRRNGMRAGIFLVFKHSLSAPVPAGRVCSTCMCCYVHAHYLSHTIRGKRWGNFFNKFSPFPGVLQDGVRDTDLHSVSHCWITLHICSVHTDTHTPTRETICARMGKLFRKVPSRWVQVRGVLRGWNKPKPWKLWSFSRLEFMIRQWNPTMTYVSWRTLKSPPNIRAFHMLNYVYF